MQMAGFDRRVYCKRNGHIKGDDPLTTIADNVAHIGENAINLAAHIDIIVYGALIIGGAIVVSTLIRDLRGL
jgi:hypothetical protein